MTAGWVAIAISLVSIGINIYVLCDRRKKGGRS
jgi:hypothetical protein